MKLTVAVTLRPTPEQADALLRTLERANEAANYLSAGAWHSRTFGQYALHKAAYADVRARTGLTAQLVVRLISKVADAYKLDTKRERRFRPHGSIAYDDRILRWYTDTGAVSIWTVDGRAHIPFVCGERQHALLAMRQGESDLVYRGGVWYLLATVTYEEPPPGEPDDYLGVDLGIVSLAVDSDGTTYSGDAIEEKRRTYAHRRRNLQRKRTKSAKRKLKTLSGKQARYQSNENHAISRRIVRTAQDTQRGVALENLTGLSARTTVRRPRRARHKNWSYRQIGEYITYKACMAGVRVVTVDPRHTSQRRHVCGHTERANRHSQSSFLCRQCGFGGPVDHNAAVTIALMARATVNRPMVSGVRA